MMYVIPKDALPFTIRKGNWGAEHYKVPNHAYVFNGKYWFLKKLDHFGPIEALSSIPLEVRTKQLLMG